jgi:large subunit ribosomal protein L25
MAKTSATKLDARRRSAEGSRAARRLRRAGRVPGVLYGGGEDPVAFDVDARELRQALAGASAVIDVSIDGGSTSAVVKHTDHHPVRGETLHFDLLRVRLDVAIEATVTLELQGAEEAPGVREGGIVDQVTHEVTVVALPTDIPHAIVHDISGMEMHDTLFLSAVSPPEGVTLAGDLDEIVVATLSPPRVEIEPETEIEQEPELVGVGAAPAVGEQAAAEGEPEGGAEGAE